jgi:rhodanese-related sulfurtransferase
MARDELVRRNGRWSQGIWQGAVILVLAAAVGLLVNQLRPGRLPLVSDWSMKAQVASSGLGAEAVIALEDAEVLFFSGTGVFIDARPEESYNQGHIAGARSLPWEEVETAYPRALEGVPKDARIVTYCDGESCGLSKELALNLLQKGYTHVRVLVNGWTGWLQSGLPVEG